MINIAVVGLGYWGPNLARSFDQLKDSNLYACCDLDVKKLKNIKKQYASAITTRDYEDILKDKKINAVVIATSGATHFKLAKKALLSEKHVFAKKPLALKVKNAEELVKISEKKREN